MSLLVTGDDTVRRLNRDYRGVDEVTDVLSFSSSYSGRWEGDGEAPNDPNATPNNNDLPFILPPGQLPPLGEVIISYPQANRQALERGQPLDQEIALLIIHGVLHLAGQDHLDPQEEARMQAKERAALKLMLEKTDPHVANAHNRTA